MNKVIIGLIALSFNAVAYNPDKPMYHFESTNDVTTITVNIGEYDEIMLECLQTGTRRFKKQFILDGDMVIRRGDMTVVMRGEHMQFALWGYSCIIDEHLR